MEKRECGPDLIRCLALLFVVTFHFYLYNGYYFQPQTGAAMAAAGAVRWLSVGCIGLFLMLTGYLKSGKPWAKGYYRGLWAVLAGYLLASALSIPVRHFLLGDRQSLPVWLTRLACFQGVYYGWYVEMYVGLYLISPLLNLAVQALAERPKGLLLLCASLLALTALPGTAAVPLLPDYWRAFYPVTYYMLGAAVRALGPKLPPWAGILGAAAVALALGLATVLSTDGPLDTAYTLEFPDLWIVCIVLLLFLGLYRVSLPPAGRKVLAWAAGGCYGGYLLSHLLDASLYRLLPQWHRPEAYPLLYLCVSLPIFLAALVLGRLLEDGVRLLLPGRTGGRV